jgi:hypothetical protein
MKKFFIQISAAEPHHFYAAPAPGEIFYASPAPAPTLQNSMPKSFKVIQVNRRPGILFSSDSI